jgi:hypothetical protein
VVSKIRIFSGKAFNKAIPHFSSPLFGGVTLNIKVLVQYTNNIRMI